MTLHPLLGLVIESGALRLSVPTDDEMPELINVARQGIHDPAERPFAVPWTEIPDPEFGWQFAQHQWLSRATSNPERWAINLMVRYQDQIVGMQSLRGTDFLHLGEVDTGSWISRSLHGQGLGTQVRAIALEFLFVDLHAQRALSGAFEHNKASMAVSSKLGYHKCSEGYYYNGRETVGFTHFRIERDTWMNGPHRREISTYGTHDVRVLLGIE